MCCPPRRAAGNRPPRPRLRRALAGASAIAAWAAVGLSAQSCGVFSSSADCAAKATCVDIGAASTSSGGGSSGGSSSGSGSSGAGNSGAGNSGGGSGGGSSGANVRDASFDVAVGAEGATVDQGATSDAAIDTTATHGSDAGDSAVGVSACGLPSPLPSGGLVYDGGMASPTCSQSISPANYPNNSWYSYSDGTRDGGTFVHTADSGGCEGPTDCAFHAMGSGFTGYGAGVGFTLNNNSLFDASGYSGLEVWLKGTTTGTRTAAYAKQDDSVHLKFQTGSPDASTTDPRQGDDYGGYCSTVGADGGAGGWVMCRLAFASLTRDGFRGVDAGAPDPATDRFNPQNLVKIEFEFSAYTLSNGKTVGPVGFDVWIDDVAFF